MVGRGRDLHTEEAAATPVQSKYIQGDSDKGAGYPPPESFPGNPEIRFSSVSPYLPYDRLGAAIGGGDGGDGCGRSAVAQQRPRGPRAADGGRRDSLSPRVSEARAPAPPPDWPPPLPRPSSLVSPPPSLLPPPLSLAGRARHGAASPPMALRRSMGRPVLETPILPALHTKVPL
ncbi:WASH complex subunit 1-like [Suricata suricatta]|uniref:WASH complex subunit 1-like n=1 Tax=Suricata suricatta TaxID=37032 RepID=UPI0011556A22|nr:WASH complex subunit 1-like [Suricata suricatta]